MTEYIIYINGRPVTTIGLSCFPGCDEAAIATRTHSDFFIATKFALFQCEKQSEAIIPQPRKEGCEIA